MKKILSILFISVAFLSNAQFNRLNDWNQSGNILGVNTSFLGTLDNTSISMKTYTNTGYLKYDSLGNFIYNYPSAGFSNKIQLSPWTGFNQIPAIYIGVNTPANGNYAILADGSNNIFNAPTSLGLRTNNVTFLSANTSYTTTGSFVQLAGITVPTVASNNAISSLNVAGNSLTFSVGTTSVNRNVLISADNLAALTTATITDASGLDVIQPAIDSGMTFTRRWAARFTGAGVFSTSLSVGASITTSVPANFYVIGTSSITGAETIGGTLTGSVGIVSVSKTAGIGYATGSGSTVTQGTSRTTGVTINSICGEITLFTANGLATYQTFVVTNSAMAATDNVIINQKSGTDLYIMTVTNKAAGSFKISFATTGGVTNEAPVFGYSIIKSVNN